jgi:hypothetical protein
MQSPPVLPKKARSKSQSPPSSLPACSLQDVLDFDDNETVLTAFEQQMHKLTGNSSSTQLHQRQKQSSGGPLPRNARTYRRQFGRASSMTFDSTDDSNDNPHRNLSMTNIVETSIIPERWGRSNISHGYFIEEDFVDDCSLSFNVNTGEKSMLSMEDGEHSFDGCRPMILPIPPDLNGSRNKGNNVLRRSSSVHLPVSTNISPRRQICSQSDMFSDEICDEEYTNGHCDFTLGMSGTESNGYERNDVSNIAHGRLPRRRSHNLSENLSPSAKFSHSHIDTLPFRNNGRVYRSMSMVGCSIPPRAHSSTDWLTNNEIPHNENAIESTERW